MFKKQPTILVYHSNQAEVFAEYIRQFGLSSTILTASNPEEAERQLENTEVILGWKFPTYLLKQPIASSVQWFQSTGAGIDDLIADKTIPEHVMVTRIVDQFGSYISEYVFSFLLYIIKDMQRMRKSQMDRSWDPFISESLEGKTIGVAGLGSIGSEVVQKARAFDMRVFGLSFSSKHALLVDHHFTPDKWKEFVCELDYLVLTLPLTDSTRYVMNRDMLMAMKEDACLINVGRGALINENDLAAVMESGHLKAAILDVFEIEPLPKDHQFYSLQNIYLTSHLSGPSTVEGVSRFFVENVKKYMNHEPLQGLVDRSLGY
ncbi:D-2-hydroxyacid dehydrogenase [Bacillus sp. BRMEA1]|uniref:D-2-hydroxyacid dehydrogenase n=1 Tax=Neobacillus endophyticus TaxID=2738405 RepID=UPI001563C1E1|nr:D-2-hydroxyacid dehydrogenase [Neobacillus endophyticus]NRD79206.1 D-2-hydroxyacid dehydrogenase [Neobacillus endophyticus]